MKTITITQAAMLCHATAINLHAAVEAISGNLLTEQDCPSWEELPETDRQDGLATVQFLFDNPQAGAADYHELMVKQLVGDGWAFGPTLDENAKLSPQIIPFSALSESDQATEFLLKGIVDYLRGLIAPEPEKAEAIQEGKAPEAAPTLPPEFQLAEKMYDAYCAAVGGVAFNGDKLPAWKEFEADLTKAKQVAGWLKAALVALGEKTPTDTTA